MTTPRDRDRVFADRVRARPEVYVGSFEDGSALGNIAAELVAFLAARADTALPLAVTVRGGGEIVVEGILAATTKLDELLAEVELAASTFHAQFLASSVSGVRGLGLAILRLLALTFSIDVTQRAVVKAWSYRGRLRRSPSRRGRPRLHLRLHFVPDPGIFHRCTTDHALLRSRLEGIAVAASVPIHVLDPVEGVLVVLPRTTDEDPRARGRVGRGRSARAGKPGPAGSRR